MFNGIIEELGGIKNISRRSAATLLQVKAEKILGGVNVGDSISLNGVCLTVVKIEGSVLSFEVMQQTLKGTTFGEAKINDRLNLERPLKAGDRISGHFVLGHIDCVGVIRRKGFQGGSAGIEIAVPAEFMKYVLPKGSIAVDGISLTVGDRKSTVFQVFIIPHTLKNTTLGFKGPGDKVNIEFDILAKK